MKNYLTILFFLISLGCGIKKSEYDLLHDKYPEGRYGGRISLQVNIDIDELLNDPEKFLEKTVLISGEIIEVCPMRGCWVNVKDSTYEKPIRIKVTDGQIVFPLSAKGKDIKVEGVFTKLEFTENQARNWKVHLAEEKGLDISKEDLVILPEDLVEYRIIGQSAIIYTKGCD